MQHREHYCYSNCLCYDICVCFIGYDVNECKKMQNVDLCLEGF